VLRRSPGLSGLLGDMQQPVEAEVGFGEIQAPVPAGMHSTGGWQVDIDQRSFEGVLVALLGAVAANQFRRVEVVPGD